MLKAWNTQEEIYIDNTIEYDAKTYQVKMTILKCKRVQLKGSRLTDHRNKRWHGQRVCDATKKLKYEEIT